MDVGFDETGRQQPSAKIEGFALGDQVRFYGGDFPVRNSDIDGPAIAARQQRIAKDRIHQRIM